MKKRSLIVVVIVIAILIVIFFSTTKIYTYREDSVRGDNYVVKINKLTKLVSIKTTNLCSYKGCESKTEKCSVILTRDEYDKVMKIWDNKKYVSPILDTICKDKKVFYESYEDSYESNKENYDAMDKNKDGKVTNREFANQWLDDVIEGYKK